MSNEKFKQLSTERKREIQLSKYKKLIDGVKEFITHLETLNKKGILDKHYILNKSWLDMGVNLMKYERAAIFQVENKSQENEVSNNETDPI